METLRRHWVLVLIVTVVALAAINQVFFTDYNRLQTAPSAHAFRAVLTKNPGRAVGATLCDIVFAAGYGVLGLIGLRVLGKTGALWRAAAVLIVASAAFDELENLCLLSNIARRRTITDTAITVMRVPGTLKWVGSPAYLIVLILVVRHAWQMRAARTAG